MSTADQINLAIAIAAGFSVIVTVAYTIVTFKILRANLAVVDAMRDERLAQNRPYVRVSIFIRTGTQLLYMAVKNTGRTPAWKLRLIMERPFFSFGENRPESNLANLAAFSETIECFPPDAEMQFLLGVGPTLFASTVDRNLVPLVFEVVANYAFEGSSVSEKTTVDLKPYLNVAVPHDCVAEELQRLRVEVAQIRKTMERRDG